MPYNIDELDLKDNSPREQERTRIIFEDLKEKALNREELTEHEKDFFCKGIRLSNRNDGKIEDYECCSNFRFKITYLAYFQDLSGEGSYHKFKGTSLYRPSKKEIDNDINYLKKAASNWKDVIEKTNHSDELLKQISKETRDELKNLNDQTDTLLFKKQKQKYKLDKRAILLQSKYIYCMALQIFEMFDSDDFVLSLNGESIEITEYSIIHILNRHYSKITKPFSDKSFHIEDFEPKLLNKQLKEIFNIIDESEVYNDEPINKIAFRYKKVDYLIYVNQRTKQISGRGNVIYNRLETFFPVEKQEEKNDLSQNYILERINEDLSVYLTNK